MAEYYIDSSDLHALGFEVERLEGLDTIPGRKGETSQSWMDEDGVEPFVDADDIFLKEREILLTLMFVTTEVQTALTAIQGLQDILYAAGTRSFQVSYSNRTYVCYCKDGADVQRITSAVPGQIAYRIKVKLIEINPR